MEYDNIVITNHFQVENTNLLMVQEMCITLSKCLVGSLWETMSLEVTTQPYTWNTLLVDWDCLDRFLACNINNTVQRGMFSDTERCGRNSIYFRQKR